MMKNKKNFIIISIVLVAALVCGGSYLYIQNENAKAAAQVQQQEQAAADQAEADRLAAEKTAEQAEAERLAAEQAADQAEAERLPVEKAEADKLAAEQAEADRIAGEKAAAQQQTSQQPSAEQPKPNASTQKPVDPASLPPHFDPVYQAEAAPFGDIAEYTYIQGYGYIKDEGGGNEQGNNPNSEDHLTGNIIAY